MTPQTSALVAVADLARAYEGAKREGRQAKATIERLQGALTSSSKEAVEFEHQARTYQRQGRKTRSKLRAQREEIKKLRAEVSALQSKLTFASDQRASYLRANRELAQDIQRTHRGYDASRHFRVDSQRNIETRTIDIRACAYGFRIAFADLLHIRSEAGIEAIAAAHARATAEGLRPIYAEAIKAAAGFR